MNVCIAITGTKMVLTAVNVKLGFVHVQSMILAMPDWLLSCQRYGTYV